MSKWQIAWITRDGRAKGRDSLSGTLSEVIEWCKEANEDFPQILHFPSLAILDISTPIRGYESPSTLVLEALGYSHN